VCILLVILTFKPVYTFTCTPKIRTLTAFTPFNTPLPYMLQWFCLHHFLCYHWFILAESVLCICLQLHNYRPVRCPSGPRNRKLFSKCIKILIVPLTPIQKLLYYSQIWGSHSSVEDSSPVWCHAMQAGHSYRAATLERADRNKQPVWMWRRWNQNQPSCYVGYSDIHHIGTRYNNDLHLPST